MRETERDGGEAKLGEGGRKEAEAENSRDIRGLRVRRECERLKGFGETLT